MIGGSVDLAILDIMLLWETVTQIIQLGFHWLSVVYERVVYESVVHERVVLGEGGVRGGGGYETVVYEGGHFVVNN